MTTVIEKLKAAGCVVCQNCPARSLSNFKAGGRVAVAVYPKSAAACVSAAHILRQSGEKFAITGMGTNLLIPDEGYNGFVICTRQMTGILQIDTDGEHGHGADGVLLYAYAGERLLNLAQYAAEHGLTGLEAIAGIPGSVGGAVRMNAGSYGSETAHVVRYADVIENVATGANGVAGAPGKANKTGAAGAQNTAAAPRRLNKQELQFSYRSSYVAKNGGVITGACFELLRGDKAELFEKMRQFAKLRLERQPKEPSLGSVFKRPDDVPVAPLIEQCGLKGAQHGGAKISQKHCGFIINTGTATAQDYLALVDKIQQAVYNKFNVKLQPEFELLK